MRLYKKKILWDSSNNADGKSIHVFTLLAKMDMTSSSYYERRKEGTLVLIRSVRENKAFNLNRVWDLGENLEKGDGAKECSQRIFLDLDFLDWTLLLLVFHFFIRWKCNARELKCIALTQRSIQFYLEGVLGWRRVCGGFEKDRGRAREREDGIIFIRLWKIGKAEGFRIWDSPKLRI